MKIVIIVGCTLATSALWFHVIGPKIDSLKDFPLWWEALK